ncbi:MAG: transcription-repair coupling factor [Eubacteriales bacterium]|nr:transcription-repair coupling factor [Eubacteriales bacterium]MDD4389241.1 transcription-repair coupling factor [Eubacteriales bacterium]
MAQRPISISGISESRVAPVAAEISKRQDGHSLIIVPSQVRAKRLAIDLSFFSGKEVYVLPEEGELFARYEAKSREALFKKMKVIKALMSDEKCTVIAPISAVLKKLTPHREHEKNFVKLERGQTTDIRGICKALALMGYERTTMTDRHGAFSLRGDILDIFTPDAILPYRIEFFDDEIDSIRTFDPDTQRSSENLKYIEIYPALSLVSDKEIFDVAAKNVQKEYNAHIKRLEKKAENPNSSISRETLDNLEERARELVGYMQAITNIQLLESYLHYFYEDLETICDYLGEGSCIMIDDPQRVYESVELMSKEAKEDFESLLEKGRVIPKDASMLPSLKDYTDIYGRQNVYLFTPFTGSLKGIDSYAELRNIKSRQTPSFNGRMDILKEELERWIKNSYKVTIVCETDDKLARMEEFLKNSGLHTRVWLKQGKITSGMELPEEKLCYIWEGDIFATRKKSSSRKKKTGENAIKSFSDLRKGDFVVHENHGIGKFVKIEQLDIQGTKKDYLQIKYGGEDVLYVPVEQMDVVQKYIGAGDASPRLSKLSGAEWKSTKARAKASIANMAKEMLELSAERKARKGYKFGGDTVWQAEFEEAFPYAETDDQLKCTEEIKADMEKDISMDRLLCGDVGYGKTEVAARAIFKCAAEGKQAVFLVPTTLLASQHYYSLKERFEKFPFTVEMLSRFRTEEQQKKILEKLEKGAIDVIIGTHRLLSKDIKFKDLGLLVIDEEQRFGVNHKETVKMLKKNVDVLTLSATPIPRTLHMSLVGMKDMSLISEPPDERYPVQTYVVEQDEELIRSVIEREIARGGQVYAVFNRVQGIYKIASMIEELVPTASVAVGHGQMNSGKLEKVMLDFMNGDTNVLVATTIIESGIDIPNVNTILIIDADRFGLSQLYQLRGRVGRSNRAAYAYLMYKKDKVLSETAEKRLRVIKEFTEFGAGFKIAMRDLEIRGAGNILGTEQSGHMIDIGYELYCKLVDDAVRALQGEIVNPDREETSVELKTVAYIPDIYIADEVQKLEMYKKIAEIRTEEDEDEIFEELIDRFGDVPQEAVNLVKISHIRSLADKLCIVLIKEVSDMSTIGGKPALPKVRFEFNEKNSLTAKALSNLASEYGNRIFIHGGKRPYINYTRQGKDKLKEVISLMQKLSK